MSIRQPTDQLLRWTLVSLVLPPVGVVLVVLALVKIGKPKSSRGLLLVLLTLVATIAGALIYLGLFHHSKANSYKYTYAQLDNYTLSGSQSSGISFSKPVEFIRHSGPSLGQVVLAQTTNRHGQSPYPYVGVIAATSYSTNQKSLQSYVAAANQLLTKPNTTAQAYRSWVSPLGQFVQGRLPASYSVNLGPSAPFTNASIKANAWQFETTATSSNANYYKLHGKTVFALGAHSVYYFTLLTTPDSWQANQPSLQKVLDSLKIDQ